MPRVRDDPADAEPRGRGRRVARELPARQDPGGVVVPGRPAGRRRHEPVQLELARDQAPYYFFCYTDVGWLRGPVRFVRLPGVLRVPVAVAPGRARPRRLRR